MIIKSLDDFNIHEFGNEREITGVILGNLLIPFSNKESLNQELVLLDLSHEDWKKLLHQLDVMEAIMFPNDSTGRVKTVVRKSQRQIEQTVSWNVFRRDTFKCRYCGADNVPLTVDHIVLWENLGPSVEDNLLTSCKKCNKTRGNMEYPDWLKSEYYLSLKSNEQSHLNNLAAWEVAKTLPRRINKRNR